MRDNIITKVIVPINEEKDFIFEERQLNDRSVNIGFNLTNLRFLQADTVDDMVEKVATKS